MIGRPERLGVSMPSRRSAPSTRSVSRHRLARSCVAARLVDVEAGQHRRERCNRRRAGVQVRRRGDLEQVLYVGRAGDEGEQRRVRLREAADEHQVVVGLAEVAHDAVAARAVRAGLVRRAFADHAEAVRVVHVQQRAVTARDLGERDQVGGVAGHAVDAVHAHEPRRVALCRQECVEVLGILEPEAPHRDAPCPRDLTAVVDRLVCARVEEDRAGGGEQRDHRHVDVCDRREDERVLATRAARPGALRSPRRERDCRAAATSWDACPSGRGRPGWRRGSRGPDRSRGSCRRRSPRATCRRRGSCARRSRRPPRPSSDATPSASTGRCRWRASARATGAASAAASRRGSGPWPRLREDS